MDIPVIGTVFNPILTYYTNVDLDTLALSLTPTSSTPAPPSATPASSAEQSSIALGKRPAKNPPSDSKHKKKKKRSSAIFAPKDDRPSSPDWPSQLQEDNNLWLPTAGRPARRARAAGPKIYGQERIT